MFEDYEWREEEENLKIDEGELNRVLSKRCGN